MQKSTKASGIAMATAAALLFACAPVATVAAADAAKVKCEGANSCKGKSSCNTKTSSCQGQNSCKGKGWLSLTQAECDAAKAKMKDK